MLSAYLSSPNIHTQTDKKIQFTFNFEYEKYEINKKYSFTLTTDENFYNLCEKISNSISKTISVILEEKEEKEIEKINRDMIKFYQNDTEINYNMTFDTFLTKQFETTFEILNKKYKIFVNTPKIFNLKLPAKIFSNFPTYPSMFEAFFTDFKMSIYTWYKSKDKINWEKISSENSYKPKNADIGFYLKLECTPICKNKTGETVTVVSENTVQKFKLQCPFEQRNKHTKNKLKEKSFRVVSYNILSEKYTREKFLYCDPQALKMEYRKLLILKEIISYNSDIICLQECDFKIYKHFLSAELSKLKYYSFYTTKYERWEGIAIFFSKAKFIEVRKNSIVLAQEIVTNKKMEPLWNKIKENKIVADRLLDQKTVLQVLVLQSKACKDHILVIANTHLYFATDANHIRLLQSAICAIYIEDILKQEYRLRKNMKFSVIFCGDFNSTPQKDVYNFFTNGFISENATDWTLNENEIVTNISLKCFTKLISTYGKPKYTNYTDDFKDCLDYIFYDNKHLNLVQNVPLLSEEELSKYTALPSIVVPSDHLALVSDFELK